MISYNVALYTSNRHPSGSCRDARTRDSISPRLLPPFHPHPLKTIDKILSLPRVASHATSSLSLIHILFSSRKVKKKRMNTPSPSPLPTPSRAFMRAHSIDRPPLKIIIFFFVFFTQATRYSLVILLIDTSSFLSSSSFPSSYSPPRHFDLLDARKYH